MAHVLCSAQVISSYRKFGVIAGGAGGCGVVEEAKKAASTPSCIIKGNRMRFISVCILLRINKDKAKSPSAYFDDGRHNPRDHGFARRSLSLAINNIQPERRQRGRCSCLSLIIRLETLCGGRKAQLIDKEKTPNSPQLHGNIIS